MNARSQYPPDADRPPVPQDAPTVSVVVPCRNERQHVEASVRSILNQESPPGGFEVTVVDGQSDDGTQAILAALRTSHPALNIVANPLRVTPAARNIGIRHARGRFIAILDAHTLYAPDYLKTCVELLSEHPEVVCVGGPIESRGSRRFGRAVAVAMSHPVGVGNARHRFPHFEGYAEGACFPVFRREVFCRVGMYDESLVRNQDDEFNFRLRQSGERVFISPRARCVYLVRDHAAALVRQYFRYGFWRVAVWRKHRSLVSWRQLAPAGLLLLLLASLVAGLLLPAPWHLTAALVPLAYVATLVIAGLFRVRADGWRTALLVPLAMLLMHMSYAAGSVAGLIRFGLRSPRPARTPKGSVDG
jgi:glycosyltransferase involved in cell wall biosynthesis